MSNRGSFRGGSRGDRGPSGRPGGQGPPGPSRTLDSPRFQRGDRNERGAARGVQGPDFRSRAHGGIFLAGQRAAVDERIANNSDKALVASFGTKGASRPGDDIPLRPSFGTQGTEIALRTNHFPIGIPEGPLYEYDVEISPAARKLPRALKQRIYQIAEQTTAWKQAGLVGNVAHDNASKLVSGRILADPLTIAVPYYEEDDEGPPAKGGKEYTLTIKFFREIDLSCLKHYTQGQLEYRNHDIAPAISALNLILASSAAKTGIVVGRNKFFFRAAEDPTFLGAGLEAWKGFYSSVRPAHRQLMVNVNVCTAAFYIAQNVAKAMNDFRRASHGAEMNSFLEDVRIQTSHLGYRKTIRAVADVNAKQHRFQSEKYGDVTVEEYFKKEHGITLQYPDLPLVDTSGEQKRGVQGPKRQNLLPPEICEILPNQPFRGDLTGDHTARMITMACKPPNINAETIVNRGLTHLGFRPPEAVLDAFNVRIGSNMAVVPGRVLPRPSIKYSQGASPSINAKASWNLKDVKFAVGAALKRMGVLVIKDGKSAEFGGRQDSTLHTLIADFRRMCAKSGMQVTGEPLYLDVQLPMARGDPMRNAAIDAIRKVLEPQRGRLDIVMVMLPADDTAIYQGLKHLCDVDLGVATVCVQSSKIRNGNPQYYANVALKVNAKLGGVNHVLDKKHSEWLDAKRTMIVGMDVTHPGAGTAGEAPSIAAVVASVDDRYAQYPGSLELQERREEMIAKLDSKMIDRLELYKKKNNELPERILVYRDGVSEGQFKLVREKELPQIVKAFKKFDKPGKAYKPKLTIVICGKRHHTRFYPSDAKHAADDGNPLPGTVVDRGVTAVYDFDFFLQAHGSLKGAARPTHYYVIHDENGFDADRLQGLTNALSYLFSRATKAVSLVSPAYYADIACWRGRCYLRKLLRQAHGKKGGMKEAEQLWAGGVHKNLKDTMFYL